MVNMNFRDLFPFDETSSTNPSPGGLPGLLRQVTPQWRPPSSLLGANPASLLQQPGRAFDAQKLQALARRDQLMLPLSSNPDDADAASPRDPNFRQLISRPQRSDQQPTGDQTARSSSGPVQVAAVPNLQELWSLFNRRPVEPAQPSADGGATLKTTPDGAACFPTPGSGVSPGRPIWPLPEEDEVASPSEIIAKLWSNLTRRGNTGRRAKKREEEEDACAERASAEMTRCSKRIQDMAHPDYLNGCIERAKTRQDMCRRNGGKPRPDEPPEWTDPDEETWLNPHR